MNDVITNHAGRPPAGRPGDGARAGGLRAATAQSLHRIVLGRSAELLTCADALDAELWLIDTWASLRAEAGPRAALGPVMLDLVNEAERAGGSESLALLRALGLVGPAGCGPAAREAAHRLAGVPREPAVPAWVDEADPGTSVECYQFVDGFGEQIQLGCEFSRADGSGRHAFMVTVESTCRGLPTGVDLVSSVVEVDALRYALARDTRRFGDRFEVVKVRDAARLVAAALAATDAVDAGRSGVGGWPELDDWSRAALELLAQRLADLNPLSLLQRDVHPVEQAWPMPRRATLVGEFLSARGGAFGDRELARQIASVIVDLNVDVLRWPPDRIGPFTVVRLFGAVVPGTLLVPEADIGDLVRVADEWLAWRLDTLDLPSRARERLQLTVWQVLAGLPRLCRDRSVNPRYPYIADQPRGAASGGVLEQVLARRSFAVPYPGDRVDHRVELAAAAEGMPSGATHLDDLDAGQAAQRRLLITVEQSRTGANPQDVAARVGVVQQLWEGEPVQVWDAARALTAAGLPREQVLERMAAVWRRYAPADPEALSNGRPPPGLSRQGYLTALDSVAAAH